MHLVMLITAVFLAWILRLPQIDCRGSYTDRWQRILSQFLFSPLLLLMTAVAIVCMGTQGRMVWRWEGLALYLVALSFLVVCVGLGLQLALEAGRSLRRVRTYPQQQVGSQLGRLLDVPMPFIAQVGFWNPELVVTQGLLDNLESDRVNAILTHEQAHLYYRDTFWFFWLGWMQRMTAWLPNTEALWQELLLLREIRADLWAAQQVDPLLLAESLLWVVRAPVEQSESCWVAFSCPAVRNRLEERIEALLDESLELPQVKVRQFVQLVLALLPLAVIPFHY
jgi:Zn-dependent protease with chaperone function